METKEKVTEVFATNDLSIKSAIDVVAASEEVVNKLRKGEISLERAKVIIAYLNTSTRLLAKEVKGERAQESLKEFFKDRAKMGGF